MLWQYFGWWICFSLNAFYTIAGNIGKIELDALQALYVGAEGDGWIYRREGNPWNFSDPSANPCIDRWEGIECSLGCAAKPSCTIVALELTRMHMVGTISTEISGLSSLTSLIIRGEHSLTGGIPETIGELTNLVGLEISGSSMLDPIPSSIGQLRGLERLSFDTNSLIAPIPSSMSQLTALKLLMLGHNEFTCSIPMWFFNLTRLEQVELFSNRFYGTIPAAISSWVHLRQLSLFHNAFVGTIPSELFSLTNITDIDFEFNYLHGPFPTAVGNLKKALYINFNANHLYSSLPSSIGELSSLRGLFLKWNRLTGTLPWEIGNMTALNKLYLTDNSFYGSLPPTIGGLVHLRDVFIDRNHFSQSLPDTIGDLLRLFQLEISNNCFTGTLPLTLTRLTNMAALNANDNYLEISVDSVTGVSFLPLSEHAVVVLLQANRMTGTIPTSLCTITGLLELVLTNNDMYGTLPLCLGDLPLQILDVSVNRLSGVLPSSFSYWTGNTMVLSSNFFHGDLDSIFPVDYDSTIKVMDLSNNAFTGLLPVSLFTNDVLHTFVASKNCFLAASSIPEQVCEASHLHVLDLAGLRAGFQCTSSFFGIYVSEVVSGSLPPCLLLMQNLTELYLAGNGIVSELYDISSDSQLRNLSLSYNRLHGTIPKSIQQWSKMHLLDLSFNQLTGGIEYMTNYSFNGKILVNNIDIYAENDSYQVITPATTVSLESNRLSGAIPSAMVQAKGIINILQGNLFACVSSQSLPQQDPSAKKYVCGSSELNAFEYGTSAVILVVSVVVYLTIQRWNQSSSQGFLTLSIGTQGSVSIIHFLSQELLYGWDYLHDDSVPPAGSGLRERREEQRKRRLLHNLSVLLWRWRFISLCAALFSLLILMPTYISLKPFYAMYQSQYGWVVSLALTTGEVPTVWVGCLWAVGLIALTLVAVYSTPLHSLVNEWRLTGSSRYSSPLSAPPPRTTSTSSIHVHVRDSRPAPSTDIPTPMEVLVPAPPANEEEEEETQGRLLRASQPSWVWAVTREDTDKAEELVRSSIHHHRQSSVTKSARHLSSSHNTLLSTTAPPPARRASLLHSMDAVLDPERVRHTFVIALFLLVNVLVVSVVNGGYVYVMLTQSILWQVIVSLFLVFFKVAWNAVILVPLLMGMRATTALILMALIFNNVVSPILATGFIDISCFQTLILPPSDIINTFVYRTCEGAFHIGNYTSCAAYQPTMTTISFSPPFLYSYQCSSAILQNYVPIFFAMYGIVGLAVVGSQWVCICHFARVSVFAAMHAVAKETVSDAGWPWLQEGTTRSLRAWIPAALHPLYDRVTFIRRHRMALRAITMAVLSPHVLPIHSTRDFDFVRTPNDMLYMELLRRMPATSGISHPPPPTSQEPSRTHSVWGRMVGINVVTNTEAWINIPLVLSYYKLRECCMNSVVAVLIQLSFGWAYPPLGICICLYVVMSTLLLQFCIYYHANQVAYLSDDCRRRWLHVLEDECQDIPSILAGAVPGLLVLSAAFVALFMFDMSATFVGSVVILTWSLLLCGWLSWTARRTENNDPLLRGAGGTRETELSLTIVGHDTKDMDIPVENPLVTSDSNSRT